MTNAENALLLLLFVGGFFGMLMIGSIIYHVGEWIHRKWRRSRSRVITW